MSRINLVIFDFDGTLVDTAPDLIRSTNLFLKSKGLNALPDATIRNEIGMGLRKLIVEVFPSTLMTEDEKFALESDFLKIYEREFLTSPRLFDGALAFLNEWDGQIAIVSNKRLRFIKPILEHLRLAHLPWVKVVGGDTYRNMKPHPEPLLAAIRAANTTPEETVIVGDGHPDVLGAQAIGSRCIAIDFGYTPPEELLALGAWKSIGSYADLLPLIKTIR